MRHGHPTLTATLNAYASRSIWQSWKRKRLPANSGGLRVDPSAVTDFQTACHCSDPVLGLLSIDNVLRSGLFT